MNEIINVQDLSFAFGKVEVLQGINLTVAPGEIVCITGENGCGKSTLLRLLTGAYRPASGSCLLFDAPASSGTHFHRIGYVPQTTAMEKISFPITSRELVVQGLSREFGVVKIPRKRHYAIAEDLLAQMGLDAYLRVPFAELSGGLQQRVLITRALIHDPELLFLDEPTSGVDVDSRIRFFRTLRRLHEQRGLAIVIVTHNVGEIQQNLPVNRIFTIERGTLTNAATSH
ncbi:metal ABC transporter ATP-binding protein [Corynebacterium belfantii]|uniref:metal ABC transporter ATP-binding protein n=1 Tax=Corynebacterium belfantii TaxID=2014537 RepID=UPI0018D2E35A|nr:metal ABC transporter ATP-binding protein [Corynebacterium belfantii]MBG9310051.1 metal ABC transporter ATP-binding protein [Corynebacterium belfantii]